MTERYQEFMHSHRRIESWLREQCGDQQQHLAFFDMARRVAKHNPLLRKMQRRLRELHELRNLITHTMGGRREPIAEPSAAVVIEFSRLAEQLTSPPKLPRRVLHEVKVFSFRQPLSRALTLMRENTFSQVPVADDDGVIGVLTGATVMRWLAVNVQHELVDIVATPIGQVLQEQERDDHWEYLSCKSDCAEALAKFVKSQERGNPLEVLLLTDDGGRQLRLRGIVTVSDLSNLTSSLVGSG